VSTGRKECQDDGVEMFRQRNVVRGAQRGEAQLCNPVNIQ
jgi:hypothetical protein